MKDRPRADALLLERFSRHAGRGINRFEMIGPGDRILIGVSGGKDSLALSLALQERRKWVPIDYELFAVQVEWREYPMTDEEKAAIDGFFDGIGIPLRRIQAQIAPPRSGRSSAATRARAIASGSSSTRRHASAREKSPWATIWTISPVRRS